MGMLSPVQQVHFVTGVLKSISRCELFTLRHQKGITYLRLLISNPSVRPAEIWNLITLNKWGGGQHESFCFHHALTESVWNPDQGGPARKAGRKCEAETGKKRTGDPK